eukprot:7382948-Prymnesium_polylepis.1
MDTVSRTKDRMTSSDAEAAIRMGPQLRQTTRRGSTMPRRGSLCAGPVKCSKGWPGPTGTLPP